LLPVEDPAAFESLLGALKDEHQPATPTETFPNHRNGPPSGSSTESTGLKPKFFRIGLKTPPAGPLSPPAFNPDSSGEQALLKLNRYEQSARRPWHTSLTQLLKLRSAAETSAVREARIRNNQLESMIHEVMNAPIPVDVPAPPKPGAGAENATLRFKANAGPSRARTCCPPTA
jgi:hypothetical protein